MRILVKLCFSLRRLRFVYVITPVLRHNPHSAELLPSFATAVANLAQNLFYNRWALLSLLFFPTLFSTKTDHEQSRDC
mgnify:CR=1 FL=1